jgi:membrane-bound ClpP family serine protease
MTKKTRRIIGGVLLVLGGLMLALAPETMGGLVLIVLAIAIEVTGIYLEHKK